MWEVTLKLSGVSLPIGRVDYLAVTSLFCLSRRFIESSSSCVLGAGCDSFPFSFFNIVSLLEESTNVI